MNNVIPIKQPQETGEIDWPEHATLLQLCTQYAMSAASLECSAYPGTTAIAWYVHDGDVYVFQMGDTAESAHLFFWIVSCGIVDGMSEKDIAVGATKLIIGDDWHAM